MKRRHQDMTLSELISGMEAKAKRDAVRNTLIAELKSTPGLPAPILALIEIDDMVSAELRVALYGEAV